MATPRLPFLYPNLMRAVRSCEPTTHRSIRAPYSSSQQAPFHTARRYAPETYHRRYGPAAEANLPPPLKPKDGSSEKQAPASPGQETSTSNPAPQEQSSPEEDKTQASEVVPPQPEDKATKSKQPSESSATPVKAELESTPKPKKDTEPTISDLQDTASSKEAVPILSSNSSSSSNNTNTSNNERHSLEETPFNPHILKQNPLEGVLHMPSPSSYLTTGGGAAPDPTSNPPNLSPAPYVHYFDTYSLVRDLSKSGFSDEQSITIMKAVRSILQSNLDLAKQSLTSKSDVENESYLFQAACSELQSSLQMARGSEMQRQRASRTQLQHEADILSQRLNQELAGLKDDIKGMFNDHKMSTREQQRNIDTSVQELNYKITVSLNSDGKSEIEGLRWILTRRAAMAIAISAFMIILFLKYYSVRKSEEKSKKKADKPPNEAKESRVITPDPVRKPKSTPAPTMIHLGESLG